MPIQEIQELCRVVRDTTVSNHTRSAMTVAIEYLTPDVPTRTIQWIVPMLRDLAEYAESYDDAFSFARLDHAADALCDHLAERGDNE